MLDAAFADGHPLSHIVWTCDGEELTLFQAVCAAAPTEQPAVVRRHVELMHRMFVAADSLCDDLGGTRPEDDAVAYGSVPAGSSGHTAVRSSSDALGDAGTWLADFVIGDANDPTLGLLAADPQLLREVCLALAGVFNGQIMLGMLVARPETDPHS